MSISLPPQSVVSLVFGGDIIRAPSGLMHGKSSPVFHTEVRAVQVDCICIVYLCVPVRVLEGGGASLILA